MERNPKDFVKLHVTGAPAIVRNSFTAIAKLDATWYEFLAGCGIKLSPGDGVFVRTRNANRVSATGKDLAFSSELDEPIREFISKYERRKKLHVVRLLFKEGYDSKAFKTSNVQFQKNPSYVPVGSISTPTRRRYTRRGRKGGRIPSIVIGTGSRRAVGVATASDTNGIYKKPRYMSQSARALIMNGGEGTKYGTRLRSMIGQGGASTSGDHVGAIDGGVQKGRTARRGMHGQNELPSTATPRIDHVRSMKTEPVEVMPDNDDESDEPAIIENGGNGADWDQLDLDDNLSMVTAVTMEEEELRGQGIEVEDIKSVAQGGLHRFSNAFLLKVRHEIRRLKRNNLWDRNVKRSPLACYLVQEILQS